MKTVLKVLLGFLLTFFLILGFFIINLHNDSDFEIVKVSFNNNLEVDVILADTYSKRVSGLSGFPDLEENLGMLFVFDNLGHHGIWMKDMNFPIDIIWLDENLKIIDIKNDISPQTYPKIFFPTEMSLFVLEFNAGFVEREEIEIGDSVKIKK